MSPAAPSGWNRTSRDPRGNVWVWTECVCGWKSEMRTGVPSLIRLQPFICPECGRRLSVASIPLSEKKGTEK